MEERGVKEEKEEKHGGERSEGGIRRGRWRRQE
jgi:hypothetical protein